MSADLSGKRIVVTGGATGIGRSTARLVSKCGARLAVFDVNDEEGTATVSEINEAGGEARYWHVDIADGAAVGGGVAAAENWLGRIDVLIHFAGILDGASIELDEFPEDTWDRVLDINLRGSFLIAKHVGAVMKKQRAGTIILTASGAGVLGGSSSFAYGSSKGGVHGLAMVMDAQLFKYGIRVNDVLPGAVDTPLKVAQVKTMHDHSGDEKSYEAAIERLVSPDDVARIYAFVASDDANLLKGSVRTQ